MWMSQLPWESWCVMFDALRAQGLAFLLGHKKP